MSTRYYPATRHELNQIAENQKHLELAAHHAEVGKTAYALGRPPQSIMQVLAWLDDLPTPNGYPTQERFAAARKLPSDTPLSEVLEFLGADLSGVEKEHQ
jgi:hypothetical protein